MTIHDKTNHIVHNIIFELRQPLLSMAAAGNNLAHVALGDMSQNIPGLPILKFSSKRDETLLCTL